MVMQCSDDASRNRPRLHDSDLRQPRLRVKLARFPFERRILMVDDD